MSALNLNKVVLCGRLTADVEVKLTQSARNVATFTLAVNRPRAKDSTEQTADFVPCVAWDRTAEFIRDYFHKGDSLCIIGKIRTRNYEKDGRKVYITEVVLDEAHFVDSKPAKTSTGAALPDYDLDESLPF